MNKKETTYQSPTANVIDICAESIICTSGTDVNVTNPFSDTEVEW